MQRTLDLKNNVFVDEGIAKNEIDLNDRILNRDNLPYPNGNGYYFYLIDHPYYFSLTIKPGVLVLSDHALLSINYPLTEYKFDMLNQYIKDDVLPKLPKVGGKRTKKRKSIKRKTIKRKSIKRKSIKRKTKKRRYTK